jgi:hypothetical protein
MYVCARKELANTSCMGSIEPGTQILHFNFNYNITNSKESENSRFASKHVRVRARACMWVL